MSRGLLVSLAALLLVAPAASAAPSQYVLPGGNVFPECVALWPGTDDFFVTSTGDGTVYRGDLDRGRTKVFLRPGRDGRVNAVGARATRDRLIVAGGVTGYVWVYSLPEGRLVRRFSTGTGGLINDVAVAPDGAVYLTDSNRGLLFRLSKSSTRKRRSGTTQLSRWANLSRSPTSTYTNGDRGGGQAPSAGGEPLDGRTGTRGHARPSASARCNLGGASLPAGDGMALSGRTLYVVNSGSRITELRLSRDWLRGSVRRQITSPRLRLPTTLAVTPKRLLVVNSQFDQRGRSPVLPFTVAAIRRP